MAQINPLSTTMIIRLMQTLILSITLTTGGANAQESEHATKATYEQPEPPASQFDSSSLPLKPKNNTEIDHHLPLSRPSNTEESKTSDKSYSAIKTLGSLLFVMALFGCLAYWMRRSGGRSNQMISGEAWEILGRGNLGGKYDVQLVRLGNRLLLIGYSPNAIQTLTEITDPAEVQSMLSSCQTRQSQFATHIPKKIFAAFSGESEQVLEGLDHNTNPAYVGSKDV